MFMMFKQWLLPGERSTLHLNLTDATHITAIFLGQTDKCTDFLLSLKLE